MRILSVIPILALPSPLCEFDYILPSKESIPVVGSIILAPFRGKFTPCVVIQLKNESSFPLFKLKPIEKKIIPFSLVPTTYLKALKEVSSYYHISVPTALKVWLPNISQKNVVVLSEKNQITNHDILSQKKETPLFFEYESQEKVIELYQKKINDALLNHEPVLILVSTKDQALWLRKELQKKIAPAFFWEKSEKSGTNFFLEFLDFFIGLPLIHIGTRKCSLWYSKIPYTVIAHNILDRDFKQYDQSPKYDVFTLFTLTQKFFLNRKIIATHPLPSLAFLEKIKTEKWNHEKIKKVEIPDIQFFDLGKERKDFKNPLTFKGEMIIQDALREKKRVLLWCDKKNALHLKKYFHSINLFIVSHYPLKNIYFSSFDVIGIIHFESLCFPLFYNTWEQVYMHLQMLLSYLSRQGNFFIQTFSFSHPVLKHFLKKEHAQFYEEESFIRSSLKLPPYGKLIKIQIPNGSKGKILINNLKTSFENVFLFTKFFSERKNIRDAIIVLLSVTSNEEEEKLFALLKKNNLQSAVDINPISLV